MVIVEEKIDRALVTGEWLDIFPNATLCNSLASISDHSPIVLCLSDSIQTGRRRKFKFENSWLLEGTLRDIVHDSWAGNLSNCVVAKVDKCVIDFDRWSRTLRPQFQREIGNCKKC